jgi:hypothetical protein
MNIHLFIILMLSFSMNIFGDEKDADNVRDLDISSLAFYEFHPEKDRDLFEVTVILTNRSKAIISLLKGVEAINTYKNGLAIKHSDYGLIGGEFIDIGIGQALRMTFLLSKKELQDMQGKQIDILIKSLDRITKKELPKFIRIELVELIK